ncbi:hypothetical protein YC2023_032115 [Brassica napus]
MAGYATRHAREHYNMLSKSRNGNKSQDLNARETKRKKSPSWALPQGHKDSTFFVLYKEVMSHKFIHVPCLKLDKIVIGPQRFHLLFGLHENGESRKLLEYTRQAQDNTNNYRFSLFTDHQSRHTKHLLNWFCFSPQPLDLEPSLNLQISAFIHEAIMLLT